MKPTAGCQPPFCRAPNAVAVLLPRCLHDCRCCLARDPWIHLVNFHALLIDTVATDPSCSVGKGCPMMLASCNSAAKTH
jgi:hypothetical protein